MAIGFEPLRGPNGEQWMGMSPPKQSSQYPQQQKTPATQQSFGQTPVDMQAYSKPQQFQNAAAAQKHQDAFVQQFLQQQAQYNQGLQSGQQPQRVDVDQVWNQAGKNIQSGAYQGNPFQTGNAQAIAGLFNQYGMAMPAGFQEQLLAALAPQSAPPMYQPQPAMGYPGGPSNDFIPKFTDPATGLPYGQPVTDGPVGPNGGYWPGFMSPPQMGYPSVPQSPPGYGDRIRNPGGIFTMEVRDRDGDGIDDRNQLGPGQPLPGFAQPPQMGYPVDPGMGSIDRGPISAEDQQRIDADLRNMQEILQRSRREESLRDMQESHPWLEPVAPRGRSGQRVTGWRPRSGVAQATPARTQGTPYRSGKR